MSEEKSAVDLIREQIVSVGTTKTDDNEVIETSTGTPAVVDEPVEEVEETEAEEKVEEKVETAEEEIEASEKTEEDLEREKAEAKTKREKDRFQQRINKEVAKRKELETELAELKAKRAEDGEANLTPEDVKKEAKRLAAEERAQDDFVKDCNKIAEAAEKIDADFNKKVAAMGSEVSGIGPIPGHMIGILADIENGGAVLSHLVNDFDNGGDLGEKLYKLHPGKMGLELERLSQKLIAEEAEAKKKAAKKVSKVPEPNKPLPASGKTGTALHDKMDMSDWVSVRNKQIAEKQAQRR